MAKDVKRNHKDQAIIFIDLVKALDSIGHKLIIKALDRIGIDTYLVNIIKD